MHSLLGREKKEEEAGFGIDLGLSQGFLPQAATMFSCVGCFWVLLSSALVAVCSFSFISPAWIVKDQLRNNHHHHHQHHHNNNKDSVSFGLLWHCSESLDHMYRCYTFGGLGKFAEIPSSSWQTSAVLCSGGCALLAVSSLLAIITIFLPSGGCERRICTLAGYMQMASAFHMNVGTADRAIKSQGVLSTELSVSLIGWLFEIDGAWPTGQPPKSIQTAGKDEMAAGTPIPSLSIALAAASLFDRLWEQLSISRYATEKEIQVFIMAAGLLVYPFGLNSSLVRSFCGDSDIYYAGECQIGWGYMLAIVGVMLTVFLPFFAKYAPKEQLSPTPLPTLL
ncbi:hypothetical protein GBF38_019364 [Nibea albiflora]|uniref:Uncharacterized protein n=1 Tax=Nibea albiflora TaxID=240163 RepID=A0ACB7F257_NIBAL|nr:hypothetical protein GBF38_019364 [Nibea albiflora]